MPIEDFLHLPETKQDEIILAALREFSYYGYDLASTNRIVAEAGISKGMLFKFFTSKENLFMFLVDKYIQEVISFTQVKEEIDDAFEFYMATHYLENELCHKDVKYQWCFNVLNKLLSNPNHPIHKKALTDYYTYVNRLVDQVMSKIDKDQLREGITLEKVREVIVFIMDGFRTTMHKDPENAFAELEETDKTVVLMMSVAKRGIYKESVTG